MKGIVKIVHLPSVVQTELYEASRILSVCKENKNNDFYSKTVLFIYLSDNGTVTSLPVFIQNILNCVPKINKAFTGLEQHGVK